MRTINAERKSLPRSVTLYGSLLLNIISSVGVIIINKRLVYMEAEFRFGTLLTVIHFIVSFLGCLLFAKLDCFKIKPVSIYKVIPISLAFCGYVVFNNLSLLTNTVSVYQTSKIICTPVIVWIEYVYYHRREKKWTLLSLIPICIGVSFTVYSDTNLNFSGSVWALLAIISNSLYTIWGKTKQSELGVTPMQLLLYQAPLSAVILLLFVIPLDGMGELMAYKVTFTTIWTIALSCVFAFGVNFSFFLFVGQTSPLTMNVLGYLKTALVFVGGFIFVNSEATSKTVFGVLLTLIGLAFYTYSKMVGQLFLFVRKEEV
ncbi:Sugar phosphate transporter domain [Trypanosoma melophagium]|uniref:Sugar phosphate transporter domain n=1 Tax=Trypanosoma melophagium TaxID=715481 RepID=UPI00351A8967|nr:Sugar phosphate transporter domain [Trypanosoma melophagium]